MEQITRQHPQQRRNFTVVEHIFDATGAIIPDIDNSWNGVLHVVSYPPETRIDRLPLKIDGIRTGEKQTYLITDHNLEVEIDFILNGYAKYCGEFATSKGQDLIIEVTNINGELYVEGKNFG